MTDELDVLRRRLDEIDGDIDLCRELSKATALSGLHKLALDLEVRIAQLERVAEEERLAHLGDEELVLMLAENIRDLPEPLRVRVWREVRDLVEDTQ